MILNIAYDQSVSAAPTGFRAGLDQVAGILEATFIDPVTINVDVGWGHVSGMAPAAGALGESWTAKTDIPYSYSAVQGALAPIPSVSPIDKMVLASLSTSDPTNGGGLQPAARHGQGARLAGG